MIKDIGVMTPKEAQKWARALPKEAQERVKEQIELRSRLYSWSGRGYSKPLAQAALQAMGR